MFCKVAGFARINLITKSDACLTLIRQTGNKRNAVMKQIFLLLVVLHSVGIYGDFVYAILVTLVRLALMPFRQKTASIYARK